MAAKGEGFLAPFTNYVCPAGSGRLGHKSVYTACYRDVPAINGVCICGRLLVDEKSTTDGKRYRLEFQTIAPAQAEDLELRHGRKIWQSLSETEWANLQWLPTVVRESDFPLDLKAQAEKLLEWAETYEQPIRNVRLLSASAPVWSEG